VTDCSWRRWNASGVTRQQGGPSPFPRWFGDVRKIGKGETRTVPESLPAWRIHGSLGPFPVAHSRIDAKIPSGCCHASANGRFPTAARSDSIQVVRCAWGSPERDEALRGRGRGKVKLRRVGRGELGNRLVGWKFHRGARARRGRRDPSSTHRWPVCGHRAPGLRSRRGNHAPSALLVKNQYEKLSSISPPLAVSFRVKATAASVCRKRSRARAFPV
jgi:hypothetical protein